MTSLARLRETDPPDPVSRYRGCLNELEQLPSWLVRIHESLRSADNEIAAAARSELDRNRNYTTETIEVTTRELRAVVAAHLPATEVPAAETALVGAERVLAELLDAATEVATADCLGNGGDRSNPPACGKGSTGDLPAVDRTPTQWTEQVRRATQDTFAGRASVVRDHLKALRLSSVYLGTRDAAPRQTFAGAVSPARNPLTGFVKELIEFCDELSRNRVLWGTWDKRLSDPGLRINRSIGTHLSFDKLNYRFRTLRDQVPKVSGPTRNKYGDRIIPPEWSVAALVERIQPAHPTSEFLWGPKCNELTDIVDWQNENLRHVHELYSCRAELVNLQVEISATEGGFAHPGTRLGGTEPPGSARSGPAGPPTDVPAAPVTGTRKRSPAERQPLVVAALREITGFNIEHTNWPAKFEDQVRAVRIQKVAKLAGLSKSSVWETDAWQHFNAERTRRGWAAEVKGAARREVVLPGGMLDRNADPRTSDPAEMAAFDEREAWENLRETQDADGRATMDAMTPAARQELIDKVMRDDHADRTEQVCHAKYKTPKKRKR